MDSNWYYYWDSNGNGVGDIGDKTNHNVLDSLFMYANDFSTTGGGGNTDNTYRYATLNGVQVALPTLGVEGANGYRPGTLIDNNPPGEVNTTYDDLFAIWDAHNGANGYQNINGTPFGWGREASGESIYWSSTPGSVPNNHQYSNLERGTVYVNLLDTSFNYVALQVL